MAQRYGRGVGSNQYQERIVAIDEEARKAARENLGDKVVPGQTRSAQGFSNGVRPIALSAQAHREATDDLMGFAVNLPDDLSKSEQAAHLESGAKQVAATSDEILSRHPNLYGQALISANEFLVRAKYDPRLQRALDGGDEEASRVLTACERLLRDADDEDLGVDGISQAISDLEGGGEWSAMTTDGTESSGIESPEDLELCRRAAALSVASSRSSSDEEREQMVRELNKTTAALRDSRLRALGQ